MATHGMPASPLVDSGLQTGSLQSRIEKWCKNMGALRNGTDLRRCSLRCSPRRVRQSWWKGVATRSLLLLHALGAGMKPASLQRCACACHTHSPYGTDAVIDSRALTRRSALELSYNGYIGLYKRWFIGVGHRACLGAMVCNETLRTKRESASCSAPLTGSFTCARLDDV